jgi:hypothetical protein
MGVLPPVKNVCSKYRGGVRNCKADSLPTLATTSVYEVSHLDDWTEYDDLSELSALALPVGGSAGEFERIESP